jgi:urease accessory protein
MKSMKKLRLMFVLCFMLPGLTFAHTGVGDASGFMHGFGHPLGGMDHLLAMVALGLWAAQLGGKASWVLPCTFVGVMILGGVLGFSGVSIPFIEEGILVSVLILGILVAGAFRFSLAYCVLIAGFFAMFHGHAHGAEMPAETGAALYSIGFALATAMLHGAGIGLGILMQKTKQPVVIRFAGGAICASGLAIQFLGL